MLFFNLPSFFENLELNIALREINTFHPEYFKTQITFHVSTGNFPYQYWNGGFNNNGLKNINLSYDKISQFQSMYNIPIRFNCSNIFINENDYFDTNMNVILNIFENGANQIEISNLNFYDYLIKEYKNFNYVFSKNSDLIYPIDENIIKIEPFKPLPLEDNSISSIVIDLPFVIAPKHTLSKDGSNIIRDRFSSFYPLNEMLENYVFWIKEAYRVLKEDGILVFKTQATITSAKQIMTPEFSWLIATECGFYTLDQFFLLAKARLQSGKIKKQQHARKYTSTVYVFKKSNKKKIDYFSYLKS